MFSLDSLILKKPYSSGIRHQIFLKNNLFSNFKLRQLFFKKKTSSGRSRFGNICFRRNVSAGYLSFRFIDFSRHLNINVRTIVKSIHLDSFRSSFVALLYSLNGSYSYILAPYGLFPGSYIYTFLDRPESYTVGNSSSLFYIPEGLLIHNIEQHPMCGGRIHRAAGTFSILLNRYFTKNLATFRLYSGQLKHVSIYCRATIGRVSNIFNHHINLGKAGKSLQLRKKFVVRGVAKNPVDHRHGGGEGKKSKPVTQYSPWGKVLKFKKTRTTKIQRK